MASVREAKQLVSRHYVEFITFVGDGCPTWLRFVAGKRKGIAGSVRYSASSTAFYDQWSVHSRRFASRVFDHLWLEYAIALRVL